MYFSGIKKIDINQLTNSECKILAHVKDSKEETLKEHTELCFKYFNELIDKKSLKSVFNSIEQLFLKDFSQKGQELFREMLLNIIIFHDIGKINPNFQKLVLGNDTKMQVKETNDSGHSLLSSIIYLDYFIKKANNFDISEKIILIDFIFLNAYSISRHHGGLNNFNEFVDKFSASGQGRTAGTGINILEARSLFEKTGNVNIDIKAEDIIQYIEALNGRCKYDSEQIIAKVAYERLILSLIFAADFYATTEFMNGIETKDFGEFINFDVFLKTYQNGEIYQSIKAYETNIYENSKKEINFEEIADVNILRNELFLDSEKVLKSNLDKSIFYLEAPTGSGKSNVALNLSFELLKQDKGKHKIIYVYPFNTLVEQNIEVLKKGFGCDEVENDVAVINSATPIKINYGKGEKKEEIRKVADYIENTKYYKEALLNRQFLNYPLVLTTHVTLFKYLFGTEKEDVFPMHQLANSVIVLDEIQSYKNAIWGEMISFFTVYAKVLNIKIIIMSATLPNLDFLSLIGKNQIDETVMLIEDRNKYFLNSIFKDRVALDFSLLDIEESEKVTEALLEKVKYYASKNKKVLVEFIKKDRAEAFYQTLCDDSDISCEIDIITGDYSSAVRNEILTKVKQKDKTIILVATQVVEAGVDIDMDIGLKNMSLFDSEEQFLGRINRSGRKKGAKAYFFSLDSPTLIYKGDVRKQESITIKNEEIQETLKNKDFQSYYGKVMQKLYEITRKVNDKNIEQFFDLDVKLLNNYKIQEKMTLIDEVEDKITIFLNSKVKDKEGHFIKGQDVWQQYKAMLESNGLEYSKKRVKLSEVRAKMGLFTYEIKFSELPQYSDRIGNLYYIEEGEQYLENDRFSRQKLKRQLFI